MRSGISDYSLDLLPALAERSEVRVLALAGQPIAPEVAARWQPVPAEAALAAEAGSDHPRLPLYQMGNNLYHEEVESLARRFPGVLTLHDLFLHHLLTEKTLGRGVFEPYRERLAADHGALGDVVAQPRRWGGYGVASLFALPAHRSLALAQRGVLVHSRWAAEWLAENEPAVRVREVPMAVPLPPPVDPAAGRAFRARFGVPEDCSVLGSFGFQTPIKRPETVIAALAQPGLERVHLLVVGQVSAASDLEAAARAAGVAQRLHVTGFVAFEEFEAAISATDLCLNLRYPTAGETSASLLRILAVGRPAIVSDYAQFADLPDEVAVKVPLGDDEVPALAAALRRLLARPAELAAMREAARAFVAEHHDPGRAADAVVAACAELAALLPPGPLPVVEPMPTTLTWGRVAGELEVGGAEEPWPVGERRELELSFTNRGACRWLAGGAGPGGVALEVQLWQEVGEMARDLEASQAWRPLPRGLGPGEGCRLIVAVRRPPGRARLRIEPHVLGHAGFGVLGGPVWEKVFSVEESAS